MDWEIQYGKLQFDQFTLHNWNYTHPLSADQTQWAALTRKWLALLPTERNYWYEAARSVGSAFPSDPILPSQEQIARIFTPHQTIQERKMGIVPGGSRAIWLRTCYMPELDASYRDMAEGVANVYVSSDNLFDDAELYDFGEKWDKVLERMPSLCDRWIDVEEADCNDDSVPDPADPRFELCEAVRRQAVMVYLLDRQALMEELITVMWLDSHGESVWWYRVSADDLQNLTGWLSATAGLGGMLELADMEDGGGKWVIKGSEIDMGF